VSGHSRSSASAELVTRTFLGSVYLHNSAYAACAGATNLNISKMANTLLIK
jgi:hypothetical protein